MILTLTGSFFIGWFFGTLYWLNCNTDKGQVGESSIRLLAGARFIIYLDKTGRIPMVYFDFVRK